MKVELEEYDRGARTRHDTTDPPKIRLQEYERKIMFSAPTTDQTGTGGRISPLLPSGFQDNFVIPIYDPTKVPKKPAKKKKTKKKKKKKKGKAKKPKVPFVIPSWARNKRQVYMRKKQDMITGSDIFDGRSQYAVY